MSYNDLSPTVRRFCRVATHLHNAQTYEHVFRLMDHIGTHLEQRGMSVLYERLIVCLGPLYKPGPKRVRIPAISEPGDDTELPDDERLVLLRELVAVADDTFRRGDISDIARGRDAKRLSPDTVFLPDGTPLLIVLRAEHRERIVALLRDHWADEPDFL